jgi:hypothetical protein
MFLASEDIRRYGHGVPLEPVVAAHPEGIPVTPRRINPLAGGLAINELGRLFSLEFFAGLGVGGGAKTVDVESKAGQEVVSAAGESLLQRATRIRRIRKKVCFIENSKGRCPGVKFMEAH